MNTDTGRLCHLLAPLRTKLTSHLALSFRFNLRRPWRAESLILSGVSS
jgi:hypothetical protein